MYKTVGLWLDHKKAVILVLAEQREVLQKIESNVEPHFRFRGGTRGKTPYGAQYFAAEDRSDKRLTGQLNKYYRRIIRNIRGAESILIMGPGEAKHELEVCMAHERVNNKIARVETSDKLTDRQFIAKVRRFFQQAPAEKKRAPSGTGTLRDHK